MSSLAQNTLIDVGPVTLILRILTKIHFAAASNIRGKI